MARGKRRPPMKPIGPSSENLPDNDEVEQFLHERHKKMQRDIQPEASDDEDLVPEPGASERDVLTVDVSDSGSDSDMEESSDDDENQDDLEERKGWGGKKKLWYGGDTHEYEIMEDEEREEALKDEEEEAIRLQNEALSALKPEDFHEQDDEETDAEAAESDEEDNSEKLAEEGKIAADVINAAAPEVPVLFKEMLECRKQAKIWKDRVHWNELARIIYHLHASFVSNVAFYLSIRTDPDSEGIDLRTHPVLVQIMRIRSQLKDALALPCEEPRASEPSKTVPEPAPKVSKGQTKENKHKQSEASETPSGGNADDKSKEKKKTKKRSKKAVGNIEALDEDNVKKLVLSKNSELDSETQDEDHEREQKRRKLNMIVGAMERERKNESGKRLLSADVDVTRQERVKKDSPYGSSFAGEVQAEDGEQFQEEDDDDDDDAVVQKMLVKKAKKQEKKARKEAEAKPHVYTFKDDIKVDARRRASSEVVKNRGLTRYRPKDKKTPRTKNRLAYSKAVVRRKGAVRDFSGTPGANYSGEASGINMSARKGSKLSNV